MCLFLWLYQNYYYLCKRFEHLLTLGSLAEGLGTGLQNRIRRFESATNLKLKTLG